MGMTSKHKGIFGNDEMFYVFDLGDSYIRIYICQKALTCPLSVSTFHFIELEIQLESPWILGVKNAVSASIEMILWIFFLLLIW